MKILYISKNFSNYDLEKLNVEEPKDKLLINKALTLPFEVTKQIITERVSEIIVYALEGNYKGICIGNCPSVLISSLESLALNSGLAVFHRIDVVKTEYVQLFHGLDVINYKRTNLYEVKNGSY